MTTEVDADYFRTHWMKCSASRNSNEATSSERIVKPGRDLHYAELQTRIQRLHESFDSWCETVTEVPDRQAEQAVAETDGQ